MPLPDALPLKAACCLASEATGFHAHQRLSSRQAATRAAALVSALRAALTPKFILTTRLLGVRRRSRTFGYLPKEAAACKCPPVYKRCSAACFFHDRTYKGSLL
jgi:hypothetical protein